MKKLLVSIGLILFFTSENNAHVDHYKKYNYLEYELFRNNQLMGFFDNKTKLKKKLKKYFSEVEILERSEIYNKINLNWYFAVCKK